MQTFYSEGKQFSNKPLNIILIKILSCTSKSFGVENFEIFAYIFLPIRCTAKRVGLI